MDGEEVKKASTPPCLPSFGCVLAAARLEESNQSPICHLPFPLLPSSPVTTTDSPSAGWPRRRANDGEGIAHSRKHSWSSVCGKAGLNVGWQIVCWKCTLIREPDSEAKNVLENVLENFLEIFLEICYTRKMKKSW